MKKQNNRRKSKGKIPSRKRIKGEQRKLRVNRQYKNTIFQMLFHEKKELLGLYNALNDSHYTQEEDLKIVTLKNAVYKQ